MFNGIVSILQDEKRSRHLLHNNVNILNATINLKIVKMMKLMISVAWVLSSQLGSIRCRWTRGTECGEKADGAQHLCSPSSCPPLGLIADSAGEKEGEEHSFLQKVPNSFPVNFSGGKSFPSGGEWPTCTAESDS